MRWMTVDPVKDGTNWYAYVNDDPVNLVDLLGLEAGDLFKTPNEAAKDFGETYNDDSIREDKEYGTAIYKTEKKETVNLPYSGPNRKTEITHKGYSYETPDKGKAHSVTISYYSNREVVALAHTHGAESQGKDDNNFSSTDKNSAKSIGGPNYIATPSGTLKKYNPSTNKTTIISKDMPSDPNDPARVNNISPKLSSNKNNKNKCTK